jgi:hypothetical protein
MSLARLMLVSVGLVMLGGCQPKGCSTSPPLLTPPPAVAPPVARPLSESPVTEFSPPPVTTTPIPPEQPLPLPEVPQAVRIELESLGATITPLDHGYNINVRNKAGFTDKDIDVVLQCPAIVDLTLEKVSVTDEGLTKLKPLTNLSRLILNDTKISGAGLKTLAALPLKDTLAVLGLRGTNLQDGDLATLKNFPRLERLDISQTAITNLSLPDLQGLSLRVLSPTETQITASGLEQLQKAQPNLLIRQ